MYLWKNFDLSIEELVKELDKEQSIVLAFLTSAETEEELDDLVFKEDGFSFILKNIRQSKLGRKFDKNTAEERIISSFEWLNGKREIYDTFYKHGRNEPVLHFKPTVYALFQFIGSLTDKKIRQWVENFPNLKKRNEDVSTDLEFFKKSIWMDGKPLLSSLCFVYFLAKIEEISSRIKEIDIDIFNDSLASLKEMIWSWFTLCLQESLLNKNNEKEIEKKHLQFRLEKQANTITNKDENIRKLKEKHRNSMLLEKDKNTLLEKELSEYRYKASIIEKEWEKKYEQLDLAYHTQQRELHTVNSISKKQETQIESLKKEVKTYYKKFEEDKDKANTSEKKSLDDWLNEGTAFFNEPETDKYLNQIESFLESYKQSTSRDARKLEEIEEEKVIEKAEVVLPKNRIGYCIIEDLKHFVIYPNGEKQEIIDIPLSIYLQPFQFINVTPAGQMIKNYQYGFIESTRDYIIHQFGIAHFKENEVIVQAGDNTFSCLEKIPKTTQLREDQIVSMDSKNQYIRFYFPIKANLDGFIESMKARGLIPYVLLRKLSGGYILRNILTDEEKFSIIDKLEEWDIEERQVLIMQEDKVCQVFRQPKFYTLSSFYKLAEHASVKKIDGEEIFIEKTSGEIVKLLDKPTHIEFEIEQVVKIDEYHNYLHMEYSTEMNKSLTDDRKRLIQNQQRKTNYVPSAPIEIKKEVLIIGKITYEFNYKALLLKHGYRTNVVDGYEPWVKIKQASKQKDVIVVVEDFISHDNMFKVKEELQDRSIVYSEKDGANFIAEKINQL